MCATRKSGRRKRSANRGPLVVGQASSLSFHFYVPGQAGSLSSKRHFSGRQTGQPPAGASRCGPPSASTCRCRSAGSCPGRGTSCTPPPTRLIEQLVGRRRSPPTALVGAEPGHLLHERPVRHLGVRGETAQLPLQEQFRHSLFFGLAT